jgi:hypothetical protein
VVVRVRLYNRDQKATLTVKVGAVRRRAGLRRLVWGFRGPASASGCGVRHAMREWRGQAERDNQPAALSITKPLLRRQCPFGAERE